MLKRLFIFFVSSVSVNSCNNNNIPIDVEQVLVMAGENRNELSKVINHYQRLGNIEKLQSAYFLIRNMPDKYGVYYSDDFFYFNLFEKVDSFVQYTSCQDIIDNYIAEQVSFHSNTAINYNRIPDLKVITSDFLIDNIDLAYQVWKEKAWARHLNFDEFCEWILPYRVMDEPLQPWRTFMYQKLDSLIDSLTTPEDPKEICMAINEIIANEFRFSSGYNSMPLLGGIDLWNTKTGICDHRYLLVTLAMRSMGVPVSIDFTNQFSNWPGSHSWTVLFDMDKKVKPFNGGEKDIKYFIPANCPVQSDNICDITSVFRRVYAEGKNKYLKYNNVFLPPYLQDDFIENVSEQYDSSRRSDMSVTINKKRGSKYAYLFCFSKGENFIIVDCDSIKGETVTFKAIGEGIYFVGFIEDNSLVIDNQPFKWSPHVGFSYFTPDLSKLDSIFLFRKYPVQGLVNQYINELNGVKLQGSNDCNFEKFQTLYTISNSKSVFNEFRICTPNEYQFFRIVSAENNELHIADVQLYFRNSEGNSERVKGSVIGSIPDIVSCNDGIFLNAFDGNIRTNFNAPKNSWVGINSRKHFKLASFRLIVRNHLNIIEPGDSYELFYFDLGWVSLGEKIATDYSIYYDKIPKGALLLLKNNSKGIEERIFTIENNTQAWK